MSFTYSECVFVALGIQHVIRMRYIAIFGLPGPKIIFHIISQTARFYIYIYIYIYIWNWNLFLDYDYSFRLKYL